jgi:hypothetical protein
VHVQLLVSEPEGDALPVEIDHLGAEDVAVERRRALPVRDGDDDVVEAKAEPYFATSIARLSRMTMTLT